MLDVAQQRLFVHNTHAEMHDRLEHGLAIRLAHIRESRYLEALYGLSAQEKGKTAEFWRVVGCRIEPGEKPDVLGLRPLFSNRISRVKRKRVIARWVWPSGD